MLSLIERAVTTPIQDDANNRGDQSISKGIAKGLAAA